MHARAAISADIKHGVSVWRLRQGVSKMMLIMAYSQRPPMKHTQPIFAAASAVSSAIMRKYYNVFLEPSTARN